MLWINAWMTNEGIRKRHEANWVDLAKKSRPFILRFQTCRPTRPSLKAPICSLFSSYRSVFWLVWWWCPEYTPPCVAESKFFGFFSLHGFEKVMGSFRSRKIVCFLFFGCLFLIWCTPRNNIPSQFRWLDFFLLHICHLTSVCLLQFFIGSTWFWLTTGPFSEKSLQSYKFQNFMHATMRRPRSLGTLTILAEKKVEKNNKKKRKRNRITFN